MGWSQLCIRVLCSVLLYNIQEASDFPDSLYSYLADDSLRNGGPKGMEFLIGCGYAQSVGSWRLTLDSVGGQEAQQTRQKDMIQEKSGLSSREWLFILIHIQFILG